MKKQTIHLKFLLHHSIPHFSIVDGDLQYQMLFQVYKDSTSIISFVNLIFDFVCWVRIWVLECFSYYHGVIILNRSNNSVFLYLKIYWNPKRLVTRLLPQILNSVFESIKMSLDHKLFLQLFVTGFCLFCSKIGKR